MHNLISLALSGIGTLSPRVERRRRSRFRVYPDIMELERLPSGRALTFPIKMQTQQGRDQIVKRLYGGGWNYEAPQPLLFEHALDIWRPGSVMDVGANTGMYSILAAAACPSRQVIALEPMPDIFAMLENNLALNPSCGKVEKFQVAAADVAGKTTIYVPPRPNNLIHCSSTLNPAILYDRIDERIMIDTCIIDTAFTSHNIAIVKIDVEGFEESVLRGALSLISRDRPLIFCEILTVHKGLGSIPELMAGLGYVRATITKSSVTLSDPNECNPENWDYLLFHRNDISSVKEIANKAGLPFESLRP